MDEVQWTTELNKNEVDRRLQERVEDIKFLREELQLKKRDAVKEEEALKVFRQRAQKAISAIWTLKEISAEVQDIRQENIYAKGAIDVADRAVSNELRLFEFSLQGLNESAKNVDELIRKLRQCIYELDGDLKYKDEVQELEELCVNLKESQLNLKLRDGEFKRQGISMDEWNLLSFNRIKRAGNLIQQGNSLRSFVEIQLKEVVDNLRDQFHRTNEKFQERISEMKQTKLRLENVLRTNIDHLNAVDRNLVNLDKELLGKHGFINVCTARLETRSKRAGQELCDDSVQSALLKELAHLRRTVEQLKSKIQETNFSRKHLQAAQLQLKENIDVQSYLIQLNEVECMTRRANLLLQSF